MNAPATSAGASTDGRRFSSLLAAMGFGVSGAAFTLGSLMLARQLPMDAYGRLTLAIALFNIFGLLAPLGMDQLLLRGRLAVNGRLLARLLVSGCTIAGLLALLMHLAGGLRPVEYLLTGIAIVAGGVVATASIGLRVAGRPGASMVQAISASFVLLLAGIAALVADTADTGLPLAIFAGGNCLLATVGWTMLLSARTGAPDGPGRIDWREALPMLGLVGLGTLSLQIERVLIPMPLTLTDLAIFGVLASVAIFPFRLLSAGVGFSLAPKLLVTPSASARRHVVKREISQIALILVPVSAALMLLAPWVAALLTGGLYTLDRVVVLAACLNGATKVAMAFPAAMLKVWGSANDLIALNGWGLVWLAMTTCGALFGARFGLAGLLTGASLAGALPTLFSFNLAWSRLGGK